MLDIDEEYLAFDEYWEDQIIGYSFWYNWHGKKDEEGKVWEAFWWLDFWFAETDLRGTKKE